MKLLWGKKEDEKDLFSNLQYMRLVDSSDSCLSTHGGTAESLSKGEDPLHLVRACIRFKSNVSQGKLYLHHPKNIVSCSIQKPSQPHSKRVIDIGHCEVRTLCPFCTSYPPLAQMKMLKEDLLLEVFKHSPANFSGNGERIVYTNTHLADGNGRGGYFHQGGGKDQLGVRWHHSSLLQSAQLQREEDAFLHPLYFKSEVD